MLLNPFLHGSSLALGLILPLGAQNTFIINQGATHKNYFKVIPAVVTAALCDTFLIILATSGVSQVVLHYPLVKYIMFVVSVSLLGYLGWKMWRTTPNTNSDTDSSSSYSLRFQVITGMTLSLFNPHAIADTIAAIGTSALAYDDFRQRLYFTAACVMVSWLWFFALSIFGGFLAKNSFYNKYQSKISAIMIWASCIAIPYSLFALN